MIDYGKTIAIFKGIYSVASARYDSIVENQDAVVPRLLTVISDAVNENLAIGLELVVGLLINEEQIVADGVDGAVSANVKVVIVG